MNISSHFFGTVQLERHSIKPCSVERLLLYEHRNMAAVDPTYPLYPIACFLSAIMLFLVFFTSFVRQSWNLGVTFLCGWLLLYNLIDAVDYIVWSDNDNIKLYFWCDVSACFYVELYNRALMTCFPSPSLPPTTRCRSWRRNCAIAHHTPFVPHHQVAIHHYS